MSKNLKLCYTLIRTFLLLATICSAGDASAGTLYSFSGGTDGGTPVALVLGSEGDLYGITGSVSKNDGTVFKMTPAGLLTTLYTFTGAGDSSNPSALTLGSDGNFYGCTTGNGSSGFGTVFKITPTGTLTTLYTFTDTGDGMFPGALVQGSDGNFYGTTRGNGFSTYGTVFKITSAGVLTTLHTFTDTSDGGSPGALIQGSDGNFYGTTQSGGLSQWPGGTVFEITPSGSLTTLVAFFALSGGFDPAPALVQGSDGDFYGATYSATNEVSPLYGTIFKFSTTSFTTLYTFNGTADGDQPNGLVQGVDGNFYGTTTSGGPGGTHGYGTVFMITPSGSLTTLHLFSGSPDGANPNSVLVRGGEGNLYGTTPYGGAYDYGTIFRISGSSGLPPAPTGLTASAGNAQVSLSWTASAGGAGYTYNVYMGTSAGGESATPVLTGITATTATVSGLANGTTYYFEVAAVGSGGTGALSSEVKATPFALPGKIAMLAAQPGLLQADLRWTSSANSTSYVILRSTVAGAEKPVAEGITTTRYTAAHLDAGTTYYFKVAGQNGSGLGPASPEVSVVPQ